MKGCAFLILLWCFAGLLAYSAYSLWYPVDPFDIKSLTVDKQVINRGETFCFTIVGEKNINIPVHVVVELINDENITLVSYVANNPMGKLRKKRCIVMPYHIIPGKYQLKWSGIYEVNSIRSVPKQIISDYFVVK